MSDEELVAQSSDRRAGINVAQSPWRHSAPNKRAAILVLPGGGYAAVAMDLEGTEICDWVTQAGMTCVLLKYRVPQTWRHGEEHIEQAPKVQLPLQDAQRAMGLLRSRAPSYGIDPHKIVVIGFSAYGLALHDTGVPVDMRLYAEGGHAFGLRRTSAPVTTEWPGAVVQWLQTIGVR